MIGKIFLGLLALLPLSIAAGFGAIYYVGAWNIVFPSHRHETTAPPLPDGLSSPAVLLFTKTNGFRHRDGIRAGAEFVKALAARRGWSIFRTENGAVFNADDLSRFDAVVFHNTTGDVLGDRQRAAFRAWLERGGGWVGTHAAGDDSHAAWPWYLENLIGANFTAHIMGPQFQVAEVRNENPAHPVMSALPARWRHEEEWYSWEESPRSRGFTILATIDEDSYNPAMNFMGRSEDLSMGDHPVVWSRCLGRGRAVYSALGHAAEAYAEPHHRLLLESALDWVMDDRACEEERPRPEESAMMEATDG